ncbi:MAG TPA: DUF4010 domain-containing protein [Xanthobacteraceae bacterium]|nr:DUF4010 domain-containing protein [Xanthobacteraceae bacterium]
MVRPVARQTFVPVNRSMSMISAPSVTSVGLLLGLSLFLGLAFEDFFAQTDTKRPGGIRTFPMLALAGGVLYLFDPTHLIPFTGGLLVLGAWLAIFYRQHVREQDEKGEPNVGLVVPVINVLAYLLGAASLALPPWVAVAMTVTAVLLLTGREKLHALARRVEVKEFVTAGEFLILTGIVLPLLPNEPVTTLTTITPHQAWLALVVVSSLSYVSYLAQRYWAAAARGLWMAALGGLYSSTATTVVLARQANVGTVTRRQAQAGITLASAIMYLRILAVIAVFNFRMAAELALPLCGLSLAGLLICALQYRLARPAAQEEGAQQKALQATGINPLELGPAALFAALFVLVSLVSKWTTTEFGISGIYWLAAVVGITDIDPFVLNLAQGGTTGVPQSALAAAILIAASSNNILKAGYAVSFGGRTTGASAAALVLLAIAGVAIAIATGGF